MHQPVQLRQEHGPVKPPLTWAATLLPAEQLPALVMLPRLANLLALEVLQVLVPLLRQQLDLQELKGPLRTIAITFIYALQQIPGLEPQDLRFNTVVN